MSGSYRITTTNVDVLARHLDCAADAESLDAALHAAGYVRLDHGLPPGASVAVMAVEHGVGLDPGHRGVAIALMLAMANVVRADGPPRPTRLAAAADLALSLAETDSVGEDLVAAIAAYAQRALPAAAVVPPQVVTRHGVERIAEAVYACARCDDVVTDLALRRAVDAGAGIDEWENAIWNARRPEEPVVRSVRHDARPYEALGLPPQLAELVSWVKAHPDTGIRRFSVYARALGVEPAAAAAMLREAETLLLDQPANPSGGPSSTT